MRPAQCFARQFDFVAAQRRAVRSGRALLVRAAVTDDGLAGDERRLVGFLCGFNGLSNRFGVMAVDPRGVPARRFEAHQRVAGFRERERTVDGDVIVVIENDHLGEFQVTGKADRLVLMPSIRSPSEAMT